MTTKGFIVLTILVAALGIFGVEGFDLADSTKYNLVALGLTAFTGAWLVHIFMPGSELTG